MARLLDRVVSSALPALLRRQSAAVAGTPLASSGARAVCDVSSARSVRALSTSGAAPSARLASSRRATPPDARGVAAAPWRSLSSSTSSSRRGGASGDGGAVLPAATELTVAAAEEAKATRALGRYGNMLLRMLGYYGEEPTRLRAADALFRACAERANHGQ